MSLRVQNIKIGVNVEIATRRFIPDSKGNVIAANGTRGRYGPWTKQHVHNLLTTAGRDFLHQQGYQSTGISSNGANYIALSSNTGGSSASHTSLADEITTGGLERAQGTYAHTAGAATNTITHTFTASAAHTAVQLAALFTAASGGTMVHELTFTAVNLAENDQLKISWTVTLS